MTLVRVMTIRESSGGGPEPVRRETARLAAADHSVPIASGQNTLTASVTMTYELQSE